MTAPAVRPATKYRCSARNKMINVQEKIEDERLGGATLADAAKKFGLTPRVVESIDRTGNICGEGEARPGGQVLHGS